MPKIIKWCGVELPRFSLHSEKKSEWKEKPWQLIRTHTSHVAYCIFTTVTCYGPRLRTLLLWFYNCSWYHLSFSIHIYTLFRVRAWYCSRYTPYTSDIRLDGFYRHKKWRKQKKIVGQKCEGVNIIETIFDRIGNFKFHSCPYISSRRFGNEWKKQGLSQIVDLELWNEYSLTRN